MSNIIVEGKDTVKFVDEEQVNQAAASVVDEKESESVEKEEEPASAFNPETGEINWDCPCLGGMADGPCGDQFKAAFSCFVFSEAEPKGLDCVEKFKGMQDCFRLHPDVYGDEIDDDDEEEEETNKEEASKEEASKVEDTPAIIDEPVTVSSVNEETSFSSWVSSWF